MEKRGMQYVAVRLPHSAEIKLQLSRQRNDLKYLKSFFWDLVVIEAMLPIFFLRPILFSEKNKSKLTISRKSPIFLPSSFSFPVINSEQPSKEKRGKNEVLLEAPPTYYFFPFSLGGHMAREKNPPFCSSSNFPYKRRRRKEGEMFTFDKHGRGRKRGFFLLLQSSVRIGFGKPPTTLSPF